MNTIFIILTLVLVFVVVIYIIGAKKGTPQQTPGDISKITPSADDDDDEI